MRLKLFAFLVWWFLCVLLVRLSLATFTVSAVIPSSESGPVLLSDYQSIEIYFSKGVVQIGEDFAVDVKPCTLVPVVDGTLADNPIPFESFLSAKFITPTVFRIDPLVPWPTNLRFGLKWNLTRSSFDGDVFAASNTVYIFGTPSLTFSILAVSSELASNLTDNLWDAFVGLPNRTDGPEILPNAEVTLWFSSPVLLNLLPELLTIQQKMVPSFVLESVDNVAIEVVRHSQCMEAGLCQQFGIVFRSASASAWPAANTAYALEMRAPSSMYSPYAGLLERSLSQPFQGPLAFRFPFNRESEGFRVRFQRWELWLRHGLTGDAGCDASNLCYNHTLAQLSSALSLQPPLPLTLSLPRRGLLRLDVAGKLKLSSVYTLTIRGSCAVQDGLGLCLEDDSFTFTTAGVVTFHNAPLVEGVTQVLTTPTPENLTFPSIDYSSSARKTTPKTERFTWLFGISSAQDLRSLMRTVNWAYPTSLSAISRVWGRNPDVEHSSLLPRDVLSVHHLPLSSLFQMHSLVLALELEVTTHSNTQIQIFSRSVVLGSSAASTVLLTNAGGVGVFGWIVDSQTGLPVPGANVTLYRIEKSGRRHPSPPHLLESSTTNAAGEVFVDLSTVFDEDEIIPNEIKYNEIAAVISVPCPPENGNPTNFSDLPRPTPACPVLSYVPHVSTPAELTYARQFIQTTPQVVLYTDRVFYTPESEVHFKGYIRCGYSGHPAIAEAWHRLQLMVHWGGGYVDWRRKDYAQSLYSRRIARGGEEEDENVSIYPLKLSGLTGGFNASFTIPANASLAQHTLFLVDVADYADGPRLLDEVNVVVGHARLPAVSLFLSANSTLLSASTPSLISRITLKGLSNTGAGLAAVPIRVDVVLARQTDNIPSSPFPPDPNSGNWYSPLQEHRSRKISSSSSVSLFSPPPGTRPRQHSGEEDRKDELYTLHLHTDTEGILVLDCSVDLLTTVSTATPTRVDFASPLGAGDSLEIRFSYISPTAETATATHTARVAPAFSSLHLALPSPLQTLPSLPFSVPLGLSHETTAQSRLERNTVLLSLWAWEDVVTISPAASGAGGEEGGDLRVQANATALHTCNETVSPSAPFPLPTTHCFFQLPELGHYFLTAEYTNVFGESVMASTVVGQPLTDWSHHLLTTLPEMGLSLHHTHTPVWGEDAEQERRGREEVMVGENVTLAVFLPFCPPRLLLHRSTARSFASSVVTPECGGPLLTVPYAFGEDCIGQCTLTVAAFLPSRQEGSLFTTPPLDSLPLSALFDTAAGELFSSSISITVFDPETVPILLGLQLTPASSLTPPFPTTLSPSLSFNRTITTDGDTMLVTLPHSPVQLSVAVDPSSLTDPSYPVEIAVFVVDQSVLDLVPMPPVNVTEQMRPNLYAPVTMHTTRSSFFSASGLNRSIEVFERRFHQDPWISPSFPTQISEWMHSVLDVDLNDEAYFSRYLSFLTATPSTFFPSRLWSDPHLKHAYGTNQIETVVSFDDVEEEMGAGDAGPPDSPSGSSASPPISPGLSHLLATARSQFVVTPLFASSILLPHPSRQNKASLVFSLPDNIGAYRVFAVAATLTQFAQHTSGIIARKPLSLRPALPPLLHVGDSLTLSVAVSVEEQKYLPCTATVSVVWDEAGCPGLSSPSSPPSLSSPGGAVVLSQDIALTMVGVPVSVGFPVTATAASLCNLTFVGSTNSSSEENGGISGANGGCSTDSVTISLEVYPVAQRVHVSDAFFLSDTAQYHQKLLLPDNCAAPHAAPPTLRFSGSSSFAPFIVENAQFVMLHVDWGAVALNTPPPLLTVDLPSPPPHRKVPSASELLTVIFAYPYLRSVQMDEKVLSSQRWEAYYFRSLDLLRQSYTDAHGRLHYYPPQPTSSLATSQQYSPDIALMLQACQTLSQTKIFHTPLFGEVQAELLRLWGDVVVEAVENQLRVLRERGVGEEFYPWGSIVETMAVLGVDVFQSPSSLSSSPSSSSPDYFSSKKQQEWIAVGLKDVLRHRQRLDPKGKAHLLQVITPLLASHTPTMVPAAVLRKTAFDLFTSFMNGFRVQAQSGYFALAGQRRPFPKEVQSLCLKAAVGFLAWRTHDGVDASEVQFPLDIIRDILQRLSLYLSSQQDSRMFRNIPAAYSPSTILSVIQALAELEFKTDTSLPILDVVFQLECSSHQPYVFRTHVDYRAKDALHFATGDVFALAQVPGKECVEQSSDVSVSTRGFGILRALVDVTFTPPPSSHPVARGLMVEKRIFRWTPQSQSFEGPVGAAQRGDMLKIEIQVRSVDELVRVHLLDPPLSGVDPQDPNIHPTPSSSPSPTAGSSPFLDDTTWWWPGFGFVNVGFYPDTVSFFAENLSPGLHTLSYFARAAICGNFTLLPTHTYVEHEPEIMGLSPTGSFAVYEENDLPPVASAPDYVISSAKMCPEKCRGSGACDWQTGVCVKDTFDSQPFSLNPPSPSPSPSPSPPRDDPAEYFSTAPSSFRIVIYGLVLLLTFSVVVWLATRIWLAKSIHSNPAFPVCSSSPTPSSEVDRYTSRPSSHTHSPTTSTFFGIALRRTTTPTL